jgi:hypothetical protein
VPTRRKISLAHAWDNQSIIQLSERVNPLVSTRAFFRYLTAKGAKTRERRTESANNANFSIRLIRVLRGLLPLLIVLEYCAVPRYNVNKHAAKSILRNKYGFGLLLSDVSQSRKVLINICQMLVNPGRF